MDYTVKFCHLREAPRLELGTLINRGDAFCLIGDTGLSYGDHLHIDLIRGTRKEVWTLADMEQNKEIPDPRQLNYFIDGELFNKNYVVTTPYASEKYMRNQSTGNKLHLAYDVVPMGHVQGQAAPIYWNRSKQGAVLAIGNHAGYGNYIIIGFKG